ncbi:hypothetical protein TYRP_011717 [Tyrophagus putrescentiae]|nr:hypothetical protein TYRP_011717 [Tyrophagus putrescentiae]
MVTLFESNGDNCGAIEALRFSAAAADRGFETLMSPPEDLAAIAAAEDLGRAFLALAWLPRGFPSEDFVVRRRRSSIGEERRLEAAATFRGSISSGGRMAARLAISFASHLSARSWRMDIRLVANGLRKGHLPVPLNLEAFRLGEGSLVVAVVEGVAALDDDEEHHPQGVHVNVEGVVLLAVLKTTFVYLQLGRHVVGRAAVALAGDQATAAAVHHPTEAKVGDEDDDAVATTTSLFTTGSCQSLQENVGELQIAVGNLLGVHVGDAADDLRVRPHRLLLRQRPLVEVHEAVEVAQVGVVHEDVQVLIDDKVLEHAHNVRVLHLLEDKELVLHVRQLGAVGEVQPHVDHLAGHRRAGDRLSPTTTSGRPAPGAVDLGEAALVEHVQQDQAPVPEHVLRRAVLAVRHAVHGGQLGGFDARGGGHLRQKLRFECCCCLLPPSPTSLQLFITSFVEEPAVSSMSDGVEKWTAGAVDSFERHWPMRE